MGVTVLVVSNLSGSTQGLILFARVVGAVVAGIVVYVGVAILLGRRDEARAPGGPAPRDATARGPTSAPPHNGHCPGARGRLVACPVCGS